MKRFFTFFILIVFSFWLNVANAQVVNMPDANLAAAVREALGLDPGAPITRQALQGLEILIAQRSQIENLTGLEHATQLKVLDLFDNEIRDIRPLAGLTQLRELTLASFELSDIRPLAKLTQLRYLVALGEIRDIRPLAGLTQLRDLNLNSNEIRDITPLAGLTQLVSLALTGNLLTDIRPLTGLTQLWRLDLNKNEIRDITPLAKLTQLRTLILRDNLLTDIRPLTGLTQLVLLRLGNNQITNVSALIKLPKLESLYLEGNPIQDMSPLRTLLKRNPNLEIDIDVPEPPPSKRAEVVSIPDANLAKAVRKTLSLRSNATITQQAMQKLTELDARNSQIKNLTGLEHATRLRRLMLRENQIRDITPLANLKSLKELILESNPVSNIRALAGLKQLTGLFLGGHAISDFTPLKNLTELERLSLWGSNISDVTLLAVMTKLRYLWLGDNNISDITPLANLTQLKVLELRDNRIKNINPLVGLKNLEELSVRGNPITDKSPLRTLLNRNPKLKLDIEIPPLSPVVHLEAAQRPPLYWVGAITGTLHRLVGDEVENLVPNVKNATSLAVDMAGGKLYWAEKTSERTGRIRGANLDGTNVKLVKNLTSVPHGIALDTVNGKLYLTNAWGKVQRLNVDGSNFQPNFITGLNTPRNLILDVTGGKVYWTETSGGSGRIRRANLDGSKVETIVTSLAILMDIAVFGNTLYWAERMDEYRGEIRSIALTGIPNITTHRSFPKSVPLGIAVDGVEGTLYWTTSLGDISRSPLDGSSPQQTVVTGLGTPERLAVQVKASEIPEVLVTDAMLRIAPSPVISPVIGEQLTLSLNITAGEAVAGYQLTVGFDATALRYVESRNGTYLPTGAFFVPPVVDRGRLELAATALTGVSNGDGTLATITFEVVAIKASALTVSESLLADSQGNTFRPVVEGGQITEPPELTADVNGDGLVNIQDVVLVASSFGKTGQTAADVNGDGVVNIADLVLVAGGLSTAAGAPSLVPGALEMFTAADVQAWLSQAHQLTMEARAQRGIRYLEQLLAVLIPKETILFPNYPNPFNPETWIPYQLAQDSGVRISIYDARGSVVRVLTLGHQSAGYYTNRSRAAYWDGRNALGERVASGVYFYTLTAGDFTVTRKMLIRK